VTVPTDPQEATPAMTAAADDPGRVRVRNRLIALGAVVVVLGGILLWVLDRSSGPVETAVPDVVGLSVVAAQHALTHAALRVNNPGAAADATVVRQSPRAGIRVRVGSLVTLAVTGGGTG